MPIDVDGVLDAARAYASLAVTRERAAAIAAEVDSLERACEEALVRFEASAPDRAGEEFRAELERLSR
jgi:hypothetical protein